MYAQWYGCQGLGSKMTLDGTFWTVQKPTDCNEEARDQMYKQTSLVVRQNKQVYTDLARIVVGHRS